jgi:hypothetical protein
MFNTKLRRQTMLVAATLAILPLAACTQSSAVPPTQAQTQIQTPRSFDSDPPEVVISASRTHEPIRK